MRYDAVLFDLGNTLVAYYTRAQWPGILARAVDEVAACLRARGRLNVDPADLPARVEAQRGESPSNRVRPLTRRLAQIFALSPEDVAEEAGMELCRRFLRPIFSLARRYDDAAPALADVRGRGLRTGILSNAPWGSPAQPWREELARHELLEAVDAAVFCTDVGWRKPAPQAFALALDRIGGAAERSLFVGDDPRWDLAGARAVGMAAVLIDRSGAGAVPRGEERILRGLREVLDLL